MTIVLESTARSFGHLWCARRATDIRVNIKAGKMDKFDEALHVASAVRKVMIGGKSAEMIASDLEAGMVRIGGFWRSPNYLEAYLHAASLLIERGKTTGTLDEIGLPGFYLQRHAIELLLKRLLGWLISISELRKQLGISAQEPSDKLLLDLRTCHKLKRLHSHLLEFSIVLNLPKPSTALSHLIEDLVKYEITDTWSRYSLSPKQDLHIPKEILIPIVEFQDRLIAIVSIMSSSELDGDSYEDELIRVWSSLDAASEH